MEATQEQLRKQVERSTNFAMALFLLIVAVYLVWFAVINLGRPSEDPAVWGQFGDYVGGVLNPLIAFLAFYWLTKSVLLQRQELQETKEALVASAKSQKQQEGHALSSVRVNALTALVVSYNSDVDRIRGEISRLNEIPPGQLGRGADGRRIKDAAVIQRIAELNGQVDNKITERDALIDEIKIELAASKLIAVRG